MAEPIPPEPGRAATADDASTRHGTANVCLRLGPRRGERHREVTSRRGARECARPRQDGVDGPVPTAELLRVVLDNRNTEVLGAWDEALTPAEARRSANRWACHDTPKHGRGRNRAEREFSVWVRRCRDRRLATAEEWNEAIAAWERARNAVRTKSEGSFRVADARKKLHWIDPS